VNHEKIHNFHINSLYINLISDKVTYAIPVSEFSQFSMNVYIQYLQNITLNSIIVKNT